VYDNREFGDEFGAQFWVLIDFLIKQVTKDGPNFHDKIVESEHL